MVLFVLASYWMMSTRGTIRGKIPLWIALGCYFGWLSIFDVILLRTDIDFRGMQEWIGLPTFLLGCFLLVSIVSIASISGKDSASPHRTSPCGRRHRKSDLPPGNQRHSPSKARARGPSGSETHPTIQSVSLNWSSLPYHGYALIVNPDAQARSRETGMSVPTGTAKHDRRWPSHRRPSRVGHPAPHVPAWPGFRRICCEWSSCLGLKGCVRSIP